MLIVCWVYSFACSLSNGDIPITYSSKKLFTHSRETSSSIVPYDDLWLIWLLYTAVLCVRRTIALSCHYSRNGYRTVGTAGRNTGFCPFSFSNTTPLPARSSTGTLQQHYRYRYDVRRTHGAERERKARREEEGRSKARARIAAERGEKRREKKRNTTSLARRNCLYYLSRGRCASWY